MNHTQATCPSMLVTVLDWGMGHATRTLPLIECALDLGWHVHVASKGTALDWLKRHLPESNRLEFHVKPGPEMKYAKRGNLFRIAAQMPKFLVHVRSERAWVARFAQDEGIRAILSDNCYGCQVPGLSCVLMSHQLQIPVPKPLEGMARAIVRHWAMQFDAVWVPDGPPGPLAMSGGLSSAMVHPSTTYLGVLSRLAKYRQASPSVRWSKVGMVSGLEPHRGLMEKALRRWMADDEGPCLIVAGKPGGGMHVEGNITTWNDPSDADLAGYSSQLDLAALQVKAILVPTPGQPEQEFLGQLWAERFGFVCLSQKKLQQGDIPALANGHLPQAEANAKAFAQMTSWLTSLQTKPS